MKFSKIHIFSFLILSLSGCDTMNPSGGLVSAGISHKHKSTVMPVESIEKVELIAERLNEYNTEAYGVLFKTYTLDNLLLQPMEGNWSRDRVYTSILIKNTGSSILHIPIEKAQFLPEDTHNRKRNIKMTFAPYISIVIYDDNTPSVMIIPRDTPKERPFKPSNNIRLSNVWDILEDILSYFYEEKVDSVVRGNISSIQLRPRSSVFVILVFPVGFIKDGSLKFPLDTGETVMLRFTEMGHFL